MVSGIEDPFTGYGRIVSGERFIGRRESLSEIANKVFVANPSNLAIIGEPRVGKSSLAAQAIMAYSSDLLQKKFLPIRINVGTYERSHDFFYALPKQCMKELAKHRGWLSADIDSAAQLCQVEESFGRIDFESIKYFFEIVRQEGIQVLFFLDEFDATRRLFKEDSAGFQRLRELSYELAYGVTYITTSRRSIYQIEVQTGGSSTLDGIFPFQHYLGPFNEEDLQEYFARFGSLGIPVTQALKNRADFYTGGHPFLLDRLSHEVVESFRKHQKADIDEAYSRATSSFTDYYRYMEKQLNEDSSLHKLLQILFGPVIDIKKTDVEGFLHYGLIKEATDNRYSAFSQHFQDYLYLLARKTDLWPKLTETETALRAVIERTMYRVYGNQWVTELERKHYSLRDVFERCRKQQERDLEDFGKQSPSILDNTYIRDLFEIITLEWHNAQFTSILQMKKADWEVRTRLLKKVRNALAHHKGEILINEFHRQQAEGYLGEILAAVG